VRTLSGEGIPVTAGEQWEQAELALAAGEFTEAVERLEALLALAGADALSGEQILQARLLLGEAHLELDDLKAARRAVAPLLDASDLSTSDQLCVTLFEARLTTHGVEEQHLAALEKTEALWRQAEAQLDELAPTALASLIEQHTELLAAAGRHDEALDCCDVVANALTTADDFEDDPVMLTSAARVLERMGRVSVDMASEPAFIDDEASILERAAAALSVALRFYETAFGGGHPVAIGAWEAVGDVMERMGHAEEAEEARATARDLSGG
jgi:tetratricopeptide (TPR) repeat protein